MRTFRWLIVGGLVALQLVMKSPVWFVLGHLGHLFGGGGEYRSELIDSAIRNFGQWWLVGFKDTGQWTVNHLADGTADITNQYIRDAVDGGLLSLVLFIVLLTRCFRGVGRARKKLRFESGPDYDFTQEWFLWCLGCALVAHVVTIISVEYFDQIRVSWYMLLAMISCLSAEVLAGNPASPPASPMESENSAEPPGPDDRLAVMPDA
jgi:hypothetical protein